VNRRTTQDARQPKSISRVVRFAMLVNILLALILIYLGRAAFNLLPIATTGIRK
jgi:hypothetical protein